MCIASPVPQPFVTRWLSFNMPFHKAPSLLLDSNFCLNGKAQSEYTLYIIYSEKQLKDYITVEKIISIQGIFVSERATNMQFSRMQNKIYGSMVTIQYHTKCTNPLYQKFTSKKFRDYIFCRNLYLVITYVLILTTDKCSHPFISNCT